MYLLLLVLLRCRLTFPAGLLWFATYAGGPLFDASVFMCTMHKNSLPVTFLGTPNVFRFSFFALHNVNNICQGREIGTAHTIFCFLGASSELVSVEKHNYSPPCSAK